MGYRSKSGNTYKSRSDMERRHKEKQRRWAINTDSRIKRNQGK